MGGVAVWHMKKGIRKTGARESTMGWGAADESRGKAMGVGAGRKLAGWQNVWSSSDHQVFSSAGTSHDVLKVTGVYTYSKLHM